MARFWVGFRSANKGGWSRFAHLVLTLLLPILLYVLVRIDFVQLALAAIVISKWRMFAVRMRYWPAHIRANAVDITVGLSAVLFMASTSEVGWQLLWAGMYGVWLLFLKPGAGSRLVSVQALLAQFVGLSALFLAWGDMPLYAMVIIVWAICYTCARHFFTNFEEPHSSLYSHIWGYFGAALVWISGHWLLFYAYGFLAQPTLLLTVIGYGLAAIYYLDHQDKLSMAWRRQFVVMMIVIVAVVLTFSDWGDRAL